MMAAVTVIVLTIPEQVQEVYVVLAQDRAATPGFQYRWILALLALFALALVFWQVARGLSYDFFEQTQGPPHPLARFVLRWLPRLLATTPLFGAALGLWLSRTEAPRRQHPYLKEYIEDITRLSADIEKGIGICIALGIVVFVITLIFEYRMRETGRTQRSRRSATGWFFPSLPSYLSSCWPWTRSACPRLSALCRSLLSGWPFWPCSWVCWPGSAFSPSPFSASC